MTSPQSLSTQTILSHKSILIFGAGRMGSALITAWLKQGVPAQNLSIIDPHLSAAQQQAWQAQGVATQAVWQEKQTADVVIVAVKPQNHAELQHTLSKACHQGTVLISIMAGRSRATLQQGLPPATTVVRAMPNTPAAINEGITAAFAGTEITEDAKRLTTQLLSAVGKVVWLTDERLMDAVTAVSGSGPAYVFLLAEVLAQAGIKAGLSAEVSEQLARQTVIGAAGLLQQSPQSAASLREQVTSPNGTTAAALAVLQAPDGLGVLIENAVLAASRRSHELGS